LNEVENITEIVERLGSCLRDISWEVIFVDDDSRDGTANLVREIAKKNRRVRCLRRIGRRGLSSACIEGMLSSSAPFLAVLDADLQHDETVLPEMLRVLKEGQADIVVGSRYIAGGSIGRWDRSRASISRFATILSKLVIRADLTDPLSGFFMVRRDAWEDAVKRQSGIGFKLLLDLLASVPRPLRICELPYEFRPRHAGESKLDNNVIWNFLMLLLDKKIGRFIPIRFVSFALIGAVGVGIHFLVLTPVHHGLGVDFPIAQSIATVMAMTGNFFLNNSLTYKDIRLRGLGFLRGLISFYVACSVGAVANIAVAAYLFQMETGWLSAALAGILIGAVWNYSVTSVYTWNTSKFR
jgi:dolichol-phosphate mannosyltransferase